MPTPQHSLTDAAGRGPLREPDRDALRDARADDGGDGDDGNDPRPLVSREAFREGVGEQADFREQFDEDLYNDREEPPVQGNTADVAMGDHRFGSDAEAYTEYAHRRPGEDSTVGQARDPADIGADDDDSL